MCVKLKARMLIFILIPVLIVFGLVISYINFSLQASQEKSATGLAEAKSKEYAANLKIFFENDLNVASNLAKDLENTVASQGADRFKIIGEMERILSENENLVGIWCAFEPNTFDGKDSAFVDAEYHNSTGRFYPYLYREGDTISGESFNVGDENNEYYAVPFNTGKEVITEPYMEPINIDGQDEILMTSLAVPIRHNERIIGVAGVDIKLDQMQKFIADLKIFDTGFGRLISSQGVVAAHPEKERVGELGGEFKDGKGKDILQRLQQGQTFSGIEYSESLKRDVFKSFTPISVGDTGITWAFGTVVPTEEIYQEVNSLSKKVLILGLLGLLSIAVIVWFTSEKITKPIRVITEQVQRLGSYDFCSQRNDVALVGLNRKDEIGIMSNALINMQNSIVLLIKGIASVSEQVSTASKELTDISEQVAQASVEVAKTTESISEGASSQAMDTELGVAKIKELGQVVEHNRTLLAMASQASDEITSASGEVYQVIINTNESAQKIESASQMIKSIAEQTNLLALNAAIEAARAGEAGKGFAVVAEEIRVLAEKSKVFTEEISAVIQELIEKINKAVLITRDVGEILSDQDQPMESDSTRYEGIAKAIIHTKQAVKKLEESGHIMDTKNTEIISIIQGLASIAQENAAGAEETLATMEQQSATMQEVASSSNELMNLAESMQVDICKFKY